VLAVRTIGPIAAILLRGESLVPKTLLAVDDSATMRKVLEITFAGEDFRVVTADTASSALALMRDEPAAAVIDTGLGGDDGYALAKAVRSRDPRVAVVLLASRYNPYDAARARDAGADDYADKPFDTQTLLDKVKKAIIARDSVKAAPAPAPVAPAPAPAAFGRSPAHAPAPSPPVPPVAVPAKPLWPTQRTHTLSFEGGPPAPSPQGSRVPVPGPSPSTLPVVSPQRTAVGPAAAPPPPAAHQPAPAHHEPPPPAAAAHTAITSAPRGAEASALATNGRLAGKLGELGLTPAQVEGVLALSREVVERVVWEVVPQLAETIIKEEITRLTRDG
jgi:CheY-like chemotaxis protein